MKIRYSMQEWCRRYKKARTGKARQELLGPTINLAAEVLGVTRTRVHQLIKEDKLDSISVYDDFGSRIGHFITQTSLERRRAIRYKPGQWRPGDGRVIGHELPSGETVPMRRR